MFKSVSDNLAKYIKTKHDSAIQVDTEIDLMFQCPGILLSTGSQRIFTKIIRSLRPRPYRKFTFTNLDRIRCSVQEISQYTPSDEVIWRSTRSVTLQRTTREFFWKCIHNTFRVGDFWSHLDTLEIHGQCHTCGVPETLEHIALECNAAGQSLIWSLTRQLWAKKYAQWPELNWGLVLGCNLLRFRTVNGALISEKGRLFAIIVSVAWNLIWNLRVSRVITHPNIIITDTEIHNRWLKAINGALQRDRLLCDKIKFGTLALKKQCVLNMWSGLLLDEASLPDNWINEGVLVGIQPIVDKIGIG
ncbi:hypothetical protein B0H13DRAFT_1650072 [Mycena leptocephala]|nr:hypothetical protein B0H13DRAFT_1650072 [Mycena leptocephala]